MPLETTNQAPLGRIDPNSLFTAPDPSIVEPRAVLAMSEAFRNGLISAQDIQQRAMMRPAQQAQVDIQTDPAVIAAQKASIVQAAEGSRMSNENAAMDLAQKQALAKIPPIVQTMHAENTKFNLGVPKTPQEWTTDDSVKTFETWKGIEQWKTQKASAEAEKALIDTREVVQNNQKRLVPINKLTATPVPSKTVASLAQWLSENPNPQAYFQKGQKPAPSLFGTTPGAVTAAPAADRVIPAAPNAGPIQDPPFAPLPTPSTPTASIPQATATPQVDQQGMALSDVGAEIKAATEAQVKASFFGAAADKANEAFQVLKASNYDQASWANWVQNYFVGPLEGLKSEGRKSLDTAIEGWSNGYLRLVSGAAIPKNEIANARKAYFTQVNDPPWVQQQKTELRHSLEALAMQVAEQGHIDVNKVKELNAQGRLLEKASSSEAVAASFVVPGVGKVTPVNAANGVVRVNYTPPASLKKTNTLVEPKSK